MVRALACFAIAAAAAAAAALALTASGTPAARCQPTVSDAAGPFQQGGVNAPRRAKIGTGHVLLGRVVAPDCGPVARALVVLWQAGRTATARRGAAVSSPTARGDFASRTRTVVLRPGAAHPHRRLPPRVRGS